MTRRLLCRAEDLPEGAGRGFRVASHDARSNDVPLAVFVVRKDGALYAYRNVCPHVGTPLDWRTGHFFDITGAFLLCATHGALFQPEDGYCLHGPCAGKSLTAVPIAVEDGDVLLLENDAPTA